MNERDGRASAWDIYVEAKKHASSSSNATEERELTLAELEAAIAEEAAQQGLSEIGMPPRAVVHPPKASQLSRWFYLTLVILFVLLVAGLFWWGQSEYGS